MLPVMLILYDLYFTKEDRRRFLKKNGWYYIPYGLAIIMFGLYLFLVVFPVSSGSVNLSYHYLANFYTALKAFLIYILLLFFPINLNADHVLPLSVSLFEWKVLISLASLILFLILAVRIYRISKAVSFGMAWFFITLLPLSNLLFLLAPHFVAERYLYLPSVGFCLIIAIVIDNIMDVEKILLFNQPLKKIAVYVLTIILGAYSGLTIDRNLDWRSEYTLWSKTVRQSPDSSRAHNNLGGVYMNKGLLDEALKEYQEAIELAPWDQKFHYNAGNVYALLGSIG